MPTVTMSGPEFGEVIRLSRDKRKRFAHRPNTYALPDDPDLALLIDVHGSSAEYAVSRLLGAVWRIEEDYPDADVGRGVQVRSTMHKYTPFLIHPRDKDDQPYVFCRTHRLPERLVVVCGWLYGSDAKSLGRWHETRRGPWAWAVPEELLRPLNSLPREYV